MTVCTCIDEGEPDFNGHAAGCPRRQKEEAKFDDPYPRSKEDRERAEAIGEAIWREMDARGLCRPQASHEYLRGAPFVKFMTEVFRAVRGEHD